MSWALPQLLKKTNNIKQKQYCSKFNKDFKKWSTLKKKILEKKWVTKSNPYSRRRELSSISGREEYQIMYEISNPPQLAIPNFYNKLGNNCVACQGKSVWQMNTQMGNKWVSSDGSFRHLSKVQFSSVQSLSCVQLFETPWTVAPQASLSFTNSWSLLKLMCIKLVLPSNHLILCHPLILLPSIFSSIRVFFNESVLGTRRPKYWSFSFSISPSVNIQDWSPLGWTGWISLQSKGLSRVFSNTTVQKPQFFCTQLSLCSNSHIHTWLLEKP